MQRAERVDEGPGPRIRCCALALALGTAAASIAAQDFPLEPNPTPRPPPIEAAPVAVTPPVEPPAASSRPPRNATRAWATKTAAAESVAAVSVAARTALPPASETQATATEVTATDARVADETNTRIEPPDAALAAANGIAEDGTLTILGQSVAPGTRRELSWTIGESFDGSNVTTPVLLLRGANPGPTLCLTAAIHGDELNGVEVVRRVANDVKPSELSGTLIGVPIVNLLGFSRGSRYLPDRRDLNRFFPGTVYGSAASRIAYKLFRELIVSCDALVDFHTGSFDRSNLPQVRGDLTLPSVLEFTRGFGATPVLHSPGSRGMLRLAATDYGIPAITFEVGAPLRLEPEKIDFTVQAISTLMHRMGMTRSYRLWAEPQATFYESKWVRVDSGGMLFSTVSLGDRVREGQRLGKVVDPIRNAEFEVVAPFRGRVIGMALNQLVLPGFAAFHLGIETTEAQAAEDAALAPDSPDGIERLEGDELRGDDGGEAPTESPLDAAVRRGERSGDESGGND
jgi:hypothetical protein